MRNIRSITEAAQAEKAYLAGAEELFLAAEKVTSEMVSLAAQTPIPVTVCGGVRSMNDIYQLLKAGAQQVCLGQAAAAYSHLITQAALAFGRQSIAIYLPVRRISLSEKITSGYEALDESGRENLGLDALGWAKQAASLGAGTIILEEGPGSADRRGSNHTGPGSFSGQGSRGRVRSDQRKNRIRKLRIILADCTRI